ncbi:glycosyltransferase [Bosea sp. (in: a-proteobacteria)]|uniref:glycosyltransferase n=1 Tax=Bosea sp. (in: a-proteobacteria) TaxID=1871050 RepID=UPI002FC93AD3
MMLTLAPAPIADGLSPQLHLSRLSGSVFLLSWTIDAPVLARPGIALAARGKRLASASLALGLGDGRMRVVVAFRHAGQGELVATLSDDGPGGDITARFDPDLVHAMAEAGEIAHGTTPAARRMLANALIGHWPSLFGLGETASYLTFLRQFLLLLARNPAPATPVARLGEGKVLIESSAPGRLAALRGAYRLDGGGLSRLACRPRLGAIDRAGVRPLHLIVDEFPAQAGGLLILQGDSGLVVRAVSARPAIPSLGRWWNGKASSRDGLRSWLVEQLSELSEQGRLLAIEMQRRLPLAVQNVRRNDDLPSAELDLAVSTPAGLLLGGWYRDPEGLLDELLLHRGEGEPTPILDRLERFPALLPGVASGGARPATGFAALVPGYAGGAPVLQPRAELRLRSGTSLSLRPALQPADTVAIRARVLAAIPPQHLSAEILERTLAPVLAACQQQLRESLPEARLKRFGKGPPNPAVSVVIPLYRVYEFLRIQIAAFAADAWFAGEAELIYVLDSPEHEAEVAHLLGGLFLAYGLPMQLVVMGRNGGFSAACNAGAAMARGEALALVNSDVIPAGDGWLPALVRRLDRHNRIGAVGPKLLYDDGSLQHAGLYFKRDSKGTWLNHHYFKGMPGNYGPANVERPVPGVTGACIVLPRTLFLEVGGFDDGYVIGDYEDSDLCLKIGRAGLGIVYVPGVALYHLERQSISKSLDYTRGVASQHNAWLQTRRWDQQIEALMTAVDGPAGAVVAPRPEQAFPHEPQFLSRANLRRATAA